jgi:hypothetical protein
VEFLEEVSHCCLNRRFETGTTFVIPFPHNFVKKKDSILQVTVRSTVYIR